MSDTPETDSAVLESDGQWSFALRDLARKLERERNEAWKDTSSLLNLIADIRAAVGDPTGKLMQDELIDHCRKLWEASKNPET